MNGWKNVFQNQKILVIILVSLLAVNGVLLGILFIHPGISVAIKNTSQQYKLVYTPTKQFTGFVNKNNTDSVKEHIPKKTKIEIVVYDETIKSSLGGIIGVYPILGEIDAAKSTKNTIVINMKVDPARLTNLSQTEIDNYVQEFIVSPLYFQSHPLESVKRKSDTVHAYLEEFKKIKRSFTLVKK
jgi:hypothetical protein